MGRSYPKGSSRRIALVLVVLGVCCGAVQAQAGKLGIIGDSIAQATNADDNCGALDVYDCLQEKLDASDPGHAFAGGDQPWSLRTQLKLDGTVNASVSGADWQDAPRQAREVMLDAAVRAVLVSIGNNDVCQPRGQSQPPLSVVEGRIDETLTYLTDTLPAGGKVYVSGLVDIVQMRDLMVARDHHRVFENCQAAWDLDYSRVKDSAIEDVCEHFFGSGCSSPVASFFLEQSNNALGLVYQGLEQGSVLGADGACGNILNGAASQVDRDAARQFNIALNELMMRKSIQYAGRNGVRVSFLNGLFEEQILVEDVSTLDCFHPSRAGQRHIAGIVASPILTRWRAARILSVILNILFRDDDTQVEKSQGRR